MSLIRHLFEKKITYIVATFLTTLLLYMVAYALCGFVPFGSNTILTWDVWAQYIPFMAWLQRALAGETSFIYTQNAGLGSGTIGMIAYYLSSPFNFLLSLINVEKLPVYISVVLLLKHGFSAVTMICYLYGRFGNCCGGDEDRHTSHKRDLLYCAFALIYAFSGYAVSYQFNVMWMDGLICLPMVCAGLEHMVREERKGGLIFSLWISLISNFYIGYMIWIFSFLYFIFLVFETETYRKVRVWKQYMFSAFGAAGVSMVLLLPLLHSLSSSKLSDISIMDFISRLLGSKYFPIAVGVLAVVLMIFLFRRHVTPMLHRATESLLSIGRRCPRLFLVSSVAGLFVIIIALWEFITWGSYMGLMTREILYLPLKLFIGAICETEFVSGLPNIWVSSLIVIFVFCFFMSEQISRKTKMLYLMLLAVLFISMLVRPLNKIWHGFAYPAGFPYRYSFLISFVLIIAATEYADAVILKSHWKDSYADGMTTRGRILNCEDSSCCPTSEALEPSNGLKKEMMLVDVRKFVLIGLAIWLALSAVKYDSLESDFLSAGKIFLTIVFYLLMTIVVLNRKRLLIIFGGALLCVELLCNAVLTFNTCDYATEKSYISELEEHEVVAEFVTSIDSSVYRVDSPDGHVNGALWIGYESVSYYSSVMQSSTISLLTAFDMCPEYMGGYEIIIPDTLESKITGLLNVKYLFMREETSDEGYELIGEEGGYYIYENLHYHERGLIVPESVITDEPDDYASLIELDLTDVPQQEGTYSDEMIYEVNIPDGESVRLLCSVAFDEGWSVTIDGEDAEVIQAYGSLLSVVIPEGEHTIIFTYHMSGLVVGAVVSLCFLMALVFAWIVDQRKKKIARRTT